jgi:hypothetical protein
MRERAFKYGKDALDRIVRRLYTDALKSPSQKRGDLPSKIIKGAEGADSPPNASEGDTVPKPNLPQAR